MSTNQLDQNMLAANQGFLKAAMDNGLSPLQSLALLKLAGPDPINDGLDPATLALARQSPILQHYLHGLNTQHGLSQLKDTPAGNLVQAGNDAFGTVAIGSGALGLTYLLGANAKKREREQKSQYPTRVTYGG